VATTENVWRFGIVDGGTREGEGGMYDGAKGVLNDEGE